MVLQGVQEGSTKFYFTGRLRYMESRLEHGRDKSGLGSSRIISYGNAHFYYLYAGGR